MNSMLRSVVSLYSAVLLTSVAVNADTLTLLDQRILHGTVVGASAQTIHFQVNGRIQEFAVPNVLSLAFNQETALDTSRVKPAPGNDRGVIIGTRVCEKTLNQALAAESADSGTWESLCLCLTAFADRNVSLSRSLDSFRSGRSTLI